VLYFVCSKKLSVPTPSSFEVADPTPLVSADQIQPPIVSSSQILIIAILPESAAGENFDG